MTAPRMLRVLLAAAAGLAAAAAVQAAELTVSAAASLSSAFKDVAQAYERQHPGAKLLLNFGGSGALLRQIANGAPVDVFAPADEDTLDQAERQGLLASGQRRDFARNTLVLVVPRATARPPAPLGALAQPALRKVAIGQPASVPAGRYARRALESAGLWPAVQGKAVYTQNVRQALDYVARGEVDAGFVYATDAAAMKDAVSVAFAVPLQGGVRYPIAPVAASPAKDEAARFIAFVLSPAGQAVLGAHGFLAP